MSEEITKQVLDMEFPPGQCTEGLKEGDEITLFGFKNEESGSKWTVEKVSHNRAGIRLLLSRDAPTPMQEAG